MGRSPRSTRSWYTNGRSDALNSAGGEFCFFPVETDETWSARLAGWEVGLGQGLGWGGLINQIRKFGVEIDMKRVFLCRDKTFAKKISECSEGKKNPNPS